jgi:hypothetical protein
MPVVVSQQIRITVPVGGETVTLICRRPSTSELNAFLKARFEAKGRKVKSHLYDAREELMYKILRDAQNAQYETASGETKDLNAQTVLTDEDKPHWSSILGKKVESWIDLVPLSWLSSAAMHFEDAQPEEEGEAGN